MSLYTRLSVIGFGAGLLFIASSQPVAAQTSVAPTATPATVLPLPTTSGQANMLANPQAKRPGLAKATMATSLAAGTAAAPSRSEAKTLMFVGVAAMIGGALIGDDAGTIISVGGLVLALYGLYNYLD